MARRVIILRGDPVINEDRAAADAGILPGHLIEMVAAATVRRCTHAGEDVSRAFALERDEVGRDIDQLYAVGDQVKEAVCYRGCRVYPFIASGQNIVAGNFLEAATLGRLRILASGVRIARALESINATAGDARIRVEIV